MNVLTVGVNERTRIYLKGVGITTDAKSEIENMEDVISWVRDGIYDATLIDLDTTCWGLFLARPFRDKNLGVPVVGMSSGISDISWQEQRAIFLENGGDDLMHDPVNPRELAATLRAVSRRYKGSSQDILTFTHQTSTLKIDRTCHSASLNGTQIHLTGKEYQILEAIASGAGRTFSKEMLLNRLYGGLEDEPEIKIIDVFVCKLRRKMELIHPDAKSLIATVWGRGYRFETTDKTEPNPYTASAIDPAA